MNDRYFQFLEANWRRKLTSAEEAQLRPWLAEHPENEADWQLESALSRALDQWPAPEVPSNFTARVLTRIGQTQPQSGPSEFAGSARRSFWRLLIPKSAFAALVAALALAAYNQHQAVRRAELARKVATVTWVAGAPSPEVMKDFESIRCMDQNPGPDEQLLALLK